MNRKQQGFSLVEMMVAMIVVLILSAGGVSAWQQWQAQQRLDQTARQIRTWLTLLRNDANWHNHDHQVRLQRNGEMWCLVSNGSTGEPCLKGKTFQFMSEWPDIRLAELTEGLAFYGLRNSAWPGHIRICNRAGERLVVSSVWGRIRIVDTPGEAVCQ
ncbi:prepilin peptidase-dependent protein [Siccibacter colletis]|uniref:Prepilin peptidase-dependent protein n=1 Tax=Siccibacter colletis TaxID=1505757 RepID=A0ABY6JBU3_9ENTR|nr:prepilin peptidase-dependent protein [Siccibacter colletis]UYU31286.1 prepilin peptidase-dependent protein [Siccibacter colletis]